MQVFISWSGEKSRLVAVELHAWFKSVIQAVRPFVSSEDIAKGGRWSPDIAAALEAADFGVICVTSENHARPWLNFEAGALSKSVSDARVAPILIDVKQSDIEGPLGQFQATYVERADMLKLMLSMNRSIGDAGVPLSDNDLGNYFDTWWPKLEPRVQEINEQQSTTHNTARRTDREILDELLENSRAMLRGTETSLGADVMSALMPLVQHHRDAEAWTAAQELPPWALTLRTRLDSRAALPSDFLLRDMLNTDKPTAIRAVQSLLSKESAKGGVSVDDRGNEVIFTLASPPTTRQLQALLAVPKRIGEAAFRFRVLRPDGGFNEL